MVLAAILMACGPLEIDEFGPADEACTHFRGVRLAWAGQGTIESLGLKEPDRAPDPLDRTLAQFYVSADEITIFEGGSERRYCRLVRDATSECVGAYDFCGWLIFIDPVPAGWQPPEPTGAFAWERLADLAWPIVGLVVVCGVVLAAIVGRRGTRGRHV